MQPEVEVPEVEAHEEEVKVEVLEHEVPEVEVPEAEELEDETPKVEGRMVDIHHVEPSHEQISPKAVVSHAETPTDHLVERRIASRDVEERDGATYENSRIRSLQDERLETQKKSYTEWVNSHLEKAGGSPIEDICTDLADGRVLHRLLEAVYGVSPGKLSRGNNRLNHLENLDSSLNFLRRQEVKLGTLSSKDIVDGNCNAVLGLIWNIMLHRAPKDSPK